MFKRLSGFYQRYRNSDLFWLLPIMVTCALTMVAFPIFGIPSGYDVPQHLRFAATYQDALARGEFLPHWAAVDNLGFGSVGIRFYPPLADYLLAITQSITGDWYTTLWTNSYLWMFPGCIGIYYWLKEYASPKWAALAAVLYAVMPYHLMQIYQYQLFSEFAASSILPFCFLFITRVINRGRAANVLYLSISFSFLVLTHIPTSIVGAIGLGFYSLFLIDWRRPAKTIAKLAAAAVACLAATSFYWLRLITEVDWVKHNTAKYAVGFYDYRQHFFPYLLVAPGNYMMRELWVMDISILLTFVFLIPPIMWLIFRSRRDLLQAKDRRILNALAYTGIFLMFMVSAVSFQLWGWLTPLQKIQFPWRFISVATILGVAAIAVTLSRLQDYYSGAKRVIGYTLVGLILTIFLLDLTQIVLMSAPLSREKFAEMAAEMRYEKGCTCWWPSWAEESALDKPERVTSGNRAVDIIQWDRESRSFTIAAGEPANARIATFYYPYWKADVNGNPVEVGKTSDGSILISVPSESSTVRLYFEEPAFLQVGKYISGAAWLLIFSAVFLTYKRRNRGGIDLAAVN